MSKELGLKKTYPENIQNEVASMFSMKKFSITTIARTINKKYGFIVSPCDVRKISKLKGVPEISEHEIIAISMREKGVSGFRKLGSDK